MDEISPPLVDVERLALLKDAIGRERLLSLCETVRQSIEQSLTDMNSAWLADERPLLAKQAHRMVGAAANFGLPALAELAARIEQRAREGDSARESAAPLATLVADSFAALQNAQAG